uniref:Uncharacterized protein n=1 Tax=Anguilla anguilla TaxID=7936 RepID=A0A0E9SNA1_ANGAN
MKWYKSICTFIFVLTLYECVSFSLLLKNEALQYGCLRESRLRNSIPFGHSV